MTTRRFVRRLWIVLPALAVGGWGGPVPQYVVPPDAPRATLSVRNDSDAQMYLRIFRNPEDCSGGQLGFEGGALTDAGAEVSGAVAAGTPLSMFVQTFGSQRWCRITVTFNPTADARYHGHFVVDRAARACHFQLTVDTPAGDVPESSARERQWRTPFLGTGAFCSKEH